MNYYNTQYKEVESGLPDGIVSSWNVTGASCVLAQNGELWGWGSNATGQLACGEYHFYAAASWIGIPEFPHADVL